MNPEQVGAIPFRHTSGCIEVLIITTRSTGRWICPKGNIEPEHGLRGSARLEAFEEAGVEGELLQPALGIYRHGEDRTTIRMWLLRVEEVHDAWPEAHERERRWLSLDQARSTVDEPGLARLLDNAFDGHDVP